MARPPGPPRTAAPVRAGRRALPAASAAPGRSGSAALPPPPRERNDTDPRNHERLPAANRPHALRPLHPESDLASLVPTRPPPAFVIPHTPAVRVALPPTNHLIQSAIECE